MVAGVDKRAVAALRRSPFFEHASVRHLRELLFGATSLSLATGDRLFDEGASADAFYVLLAGRLQSWTTAERQGTSGHGLLRDVGAPACVGESDVVLQHRRSCTATALQPSRLVRIEAKAFAALLDRSTPFRRAVRGVRFEQERVRAVTRHHDATNAERVGVLSPAPDVPLGPLVDLLAAALVAHHRERVLVMRARRDADPRLVDGDLAPRPDAPTIVDVGPDPASLFDGPTWSRIVDRYDYVLVDTSALPAAQAARFRPHFDRVVTVVRRDVPAYRDLRAGCRLQPVVLVPPEGWGASPPALPVGACRIKLETAELVASAGRLGALSGSGREAMARFARGVSDRTVGIALGGGGAWGFAHVSLLRLLRERGVPIDVVSGASFGAVVGAYFARYADGLERLERGVAGLRRATLLSVFDSGAIERFMRRETPGHLSDLDTTFLPVATDVSDGHLHVFRDTTIARAVRASGSFPFAFAATVARRPDGVRRYVDGGIASNVPDSVLVEEGADFVIASNVVPPPESIPASKPWFGGPVGTWLNEVNPILRLRDGVRSAFILMHAAGASDASLADAVHNNGPLDEMPGDFHRGPEIMRAVAEQVRESAEEIARKWGERVFAEPRC